MPLMGYTAAQTNIDRRKEIFDHYDIIKFAEK
jgi:hypothetical protein